MTGEYGVLDGAKAIAIPTRFGQHFSCKATKSSDLFWKSVDVNGETWFSAQISLYDFSAVKTSDEAKAEVLSKLLRNAVRLNSEFLSKWNGFKVETRLEFPLDWGLGSSSTLSHLVAQWADVHPILLHFKTYSGSGYDVACAGADGPIEYQLKDDQVNYSEIDFLPNFSDRIFFIHLGNKQDSSESLKYYNTKVKNKSTLAKAQTEISEALLKANSASGFMDLMDAHEDLVAVHLGLDKVKDKYFSDFEGSVKSLGAWGGDFIMACANGNPNSIREYFAAKGFNTVLSWEEMVVTSGEEVVQS